MLTEKEALEAALEFTAKNGARRLYPLRTSPVKSSFGSDFTGKKILGCEHDFWSFIFEVDVPPDVVVSPGIAIVLVDPENGKVDYFPAL